MKRLFLGISLMVIQLAMMNCLVCAEPVVEALSTEKIIVSNEELSWIGDRIFENECGGRTENLILWNKGEDFLSLGIGHFIWYVQGHEGSFDESFPKLLTFMLEEGVVLPAWLAGPDRCHCPWETREAFMRDLKSEKMLGLRVFLIETKPAQLLFLARRLYQALPKMLEVASEDMREHVKEQFYRVAHSPKGLYALIDYINFKGEGILLTERYRGKGWGLLQVLEEMKGSDVGVLAIQEFVQAAEKVLIERVNNAAPDSIEKKWLPGWQRRIQTYYSAATENK